MHEVPDQITTFLEGWHQTEWSVATLPSHLGVTVRENRRGRRTFALCVVTPERTEITLHPRLFCAQLYIPILAHECAHVLLAHEGSHPCDPHETMSEKERATWIVASHIAVPAATSRQITSGARRLRAVAREYGLPEAFVALRLFGVFALDAWLAQLRDFQEVW